MLSLACRYSCVCICVRIHFFCVQFTCAFVFVIQADIMHCHTHDHLRPFCTGPSNFRLLLTIMYVCMYVCMFSYSSTQSFYSITALNHFIICSPIPLHTHNTLHSVFYTIFLLNHCSESLQYLLTYSSTHP